MHITGPATLLFALAVSPVFGRPAPVAPFAHAMSAGETRNELRLGRSGVRFELRDHRGAVLASQSVDEASSIVIDGSDGDDTLIIDFRNGNPVPPGGLTFSGGRQATAEGDGVVIEGGRFGRVVYEYTNAHDGSIDLDGVVIRYEGLEPLTNTGTAADVVFNLPAGTVDASLQDDGTPGNGTVTLASLNASFENTTFAVPTSSLTVNAGGGTDSITVAPGFAGDFTRSLNINGNPATDTVTLPSMSLGNGALSVTANAIHVGGAISTSGAQTYTGAMTLTANTSLSASSSQNIQLAGPVDGAFSLSMTTGGTSSFEGPVGGTTPPTTITTLPAAGTTAIGANITSSGDQLYVGTGVLTADAILSVTVPASQVRFFETLDGPFDLTINGAVLATFSGAVGNTTPLTSITVSGGGATRLSDSATTTGSQIYSGMVDADNVTSFTSTAGGTLSFFNIIGSGDLTMSSSGATIFGLVGTPASLTTDAAGTTQINGSITTVGAMTFHDPVTLGAAVVVLQSTGGGNIAFNSALDGASALQINCSATATLAGTVGGVTPLDSLISSAAGTMVVGAPLVRTAGLQAYEDPVLVSNHVTFASTASGSIGFQSTLDGSFDVVVNTAGSTGLGGAAQVGGITPLLSLTTNAGGTTAVNGAGGFGIRTTGAQTYNDAVFINTITDVTTLQSTGGGNITFGANLNATAEQLAINTSGATAFANITAVGLLDTDAPGTTVLNGGTLNGVVFRFRDPVTLNANAIVTSATGGNVTFENTIDGARSLTVNTAGVTTFGGSIGNAAPLTSLTTDAPGTRAMNGSLVRTTAAQNWLDPAVLGTALTLHAGGTIDASGAVSGAFNLAKVGTGAMIVPAANTYALGTLIAEGTFVATNVAGSATGPGIVNVSAPATLAGTGTLAGNVTSANNAMLEPGDGGIGTLSLGADLAWHGSSTAAATARFQLSNVDSTSDRLAISGAFTRASANTFLFDFLGTGQIGTTYTLVLFGTTNFTAADFSFTNLAPGLTGSFAIVGNALQFTTVPNGATHFQITAPPAATAGAAFDFTVTALDLLDQVVTGYSGTVQFTSTDGTATLAASSTLSSGTGTFPATLRIAGNQTVTATDTVTPSITGASGTILVASAAATQLVVIAPDSATAGTPFAFTVTAVDPFANVDTTYAGTVQSASTDGAATLPAGTNLTGGTGTLTATLRTSGNQTIIATDSVTSSITGTSDQISVGSASATHFAVVAPLNATVGVPFNFTVTALDAFENADTDYAGTVQFTSSDPLAVLPANATLTNGAATFAATLFSGGNQTLTATDTLAPSITGTSATTNVVVAEADLAITKSASPPTGAPGSSVTYTIVVQNEGPDTAFDVVVTDVLPPALTFASATASQGTCSGTSTVTCLVGTLAPAATATLSITATLPATPGAIANTATVEASNPDTNPANDSSTATVTVTATAATSIPTMSSTMLMMLAAMLLVVAWSRMRG